MCTATVARHTIMEQVLADGWRVLMTREPDDRVLAFVIETFDAAGNARGREPVMTENEACAAWKRAVASAGDRPD